jgi:hypothetical protein
MTLARDALLEFAAAIGSASTALRRDECSDPRINGKRGHVYAVPGGFHFYCVCATAKAWTYAKRALSFAKVNNDGDEEGMLFLKRLPTPAEAETIRHHLGISKKPELSADQIEALRARAKSRRFGDKTQKKPPSPTQPSIEEAGRP